MSEDFWTRLEALIGSSEVVLDRWRGLVSARSVDNYGQPTERVFRSRQLSYAPEGLFSEEGPCLRMFQNARRFVGLVWMKTFERCEVRDHVLALIILSRQKL